MKTSQQKILLFDIDGTLAISPKGERSPHHLAFEYGLKESFGLDEVDRSKLSVHGMIDSQILLALAELHGVSKQEVRPIIDDVFKQMITYFKENAQPGDFQILPGVPELLSVLAEEGHVVGLLTGNLEDIAYHKLGLIDIAHWFTFGGFGNQAETRPELVPIAMKHAEELLGHPVFKDQVVLIGDTPLDVTTALSNDVKVIGVATGNTSVDDLKKAGAHVVLPNLTDPQQFLAALKKL